MLSKDIQAIILAAGKSTRFGSGRTKLLEKICGREMIIYLTKLMESLNIPTTVVLGYQKDTIQSLITKNHSESSIEFVEQTTQKGTADAVLASEKTWANDNILVINGDCPLINADIIESLIQKHLESNAAVTFVTAHNPDPASGYGRVIKTDDSIEIIEAKHFTGDTHKHCCVNAGIYIFKKDFLKNNCPQITPNETTQELYITDLIRIANEQGLRVETIEAPFDRIRGINTFKELWAAEQIKRSELISNWMDQGVRFHAPHAVHIDVTVSIESGSMIGCSAHLYGNTKIGKNCRIESFTQLNNATIGDNVIIDSHSIIKNSTVEDNAKIGPFAHIHSQSTIGKNTIIGNFVEVKQSSIDEDTKAKHLTYIGNAEIGKHVNIGAGTITCNHNGFEKNTTTIKDGAYIGSNNTLIAPVTIEKNAFTAAGSTITENVPENDLAIARTRQINKPEYRTRLKKKLEPTKTTSSSTPSSFLGAIKTKKSCKDELL